MTLLAGGHGTGLTGVYGTTEYDAYPLIPETTANEIIEGAVQTSAALRLFTRMPNMSRKVHRLPVLATLGNAAFVNETTSDDLLHGSDQQIDDEQFAALAGAPYGSAQRGFNPLEDMGGMKPTHQMRWENVYIVAEPIAVLLPVPEDVLDDAEYPIWDAMKPRIIEAIHAKIDDAIIWGQNRPVTWPTGIVPTCIARGQVVAEGTGVDVAEDISNLMGVLEQQDFDPTGFMAAPSLKATLRNLRDNNNAPIFVPGMQNVPDSLWGQPMAYIKNNTFRTTVGRLIAGAMGEAKYAIRKDVSWKLFTEGVITDDNGKVIYNLMQQDGAVMRVVMRLGWAVPNPIAPLRPNRAGYPFALLGA